MLGMELGFVVPGAKLKVLGAPARVLGGVGRWTTRAAGAADARRARVFACMSSAGVEADPQVSGTHAASESEPPSKIFTFQEALLALQQYWASRGCVLWHPYNTEVGAGTMNPATYLRVLGPEPWSVAYDEPSVRPDDSRYGENPNRVQRHTQFQVILKPAPENPQELLLGSYAALGIDTDAHDIRFVEDNWESPALGAWGLGWEVWLDGMEITQFTYFQQAGGAPLDKVAVEITYGLERIIMSLQQKDHFKNIDFTKNISYGEIFMQNEVEMSKYNLDEADVPLNSKLFDLYEEEAARLLTNRLPVPAYNYLLKASHTFNILDARGAVGVTERARYFQRMRTLARDVADLWKERREELGYPLLKSKSNAVTSTLPEAEAVSTTEGFLLEVGTEELPASAVDMAVAQLRKLFEELMDSFELERGALIVEATPRRIMVRVDGLAPRQPDKTRSARGPPKKAAFDKEGNPSKAALGFCRSQGVQMSEIEFRPDDKGTEYLYATVEEKGKETTKILSEEVPKLLDRISFGRGMRWNDSKVTFSRPVRWIVALLGATAVPISFAGVTSSRFSRGLRDGTGVAQPIAVQAASAYPGMIRDMGILLPLLDRKRQIVEAVKRSAAEIGGVIPEPFIDFDDADSLLAEVTNLVEAPVAIRGEFDESFLKLPKEILVTVMKKHQRYFPVVEKDSDRLMNSFITVGNGPISEQVVKTGNEAVLRARYADAAFFYDKDSSSSLEDFTPGLAGLAFQERLGSMLEKQNRLINLGPTIGSLLELTEKDRDILIEALPVAKADLTTSVVVEMTSLAGQMGRHYAAKSGYSAGAARAIFEHVLPRSAGDELPTSPAGTTMALADRLDSLVGLFGVGLAPKATADPFGLRRAALGIIQTLVAQSASFDVREGIAEAAKLQPIELEDGVETLVLDFIVRRMEAWLVESGDYRIDVIRAVLARQGFNPAVSVAYVKELDSIYDTDEFSQALGCHGRALRLVRSKMEEVSGWEVDPSLFEVDEEKKLYAALQGSVAETKGSASISSVIEALVSMKPEVDQYLDNVFVMAEDESTQKNRLKLCALVAQIPERVFDATLIQQL